MLAFWHQAYCAFDLETFSFRTIFFISLGIDLVFGFELVRV